MIRATHSEELSVMKNEPPFFSDLRQRILDPGGLFNAHLHLDRAGTLEETLRLLSLGEEVQLCG